MKSRALKLSENVWHDMFILKLYGANPNFKFQARKKSAENEGPGKSCTSKIGPRTSSFCSRQQ